VKFEWDAVKEAANIAKHGVNVSEAQLAFSDSCRVILTDKAHGTEESRFFCIGHTGRGVLTVGFTYRRGGAIRIIGAGYWRKAGKFMKSGKVKYTDDKGENGRRTCANQGLFAVT